MIKNKLNVAEDKIKEINEKYVTKANLDTLVEPAAEACHPEHRCDQVKDLEQKLQPANCKVQDIENKFNAAINYYKNTDEVSKTCSIEEKSPLKTDLEPPGVVAKRVTKNDDLIDFAPANIDRREKLNRRQLSLVIMMHQTHPDISTIQLSKMTHEKGIKKGLWDKKNSCQIQKGDIFLTI